MTQIPIALSNILALVGLFCSAYIIVLITNNLIHYFRFKAFPKSLEQEKLDFIRKENDRLAIKIQQLEKENEQMTLMVLQKLK